MAHYFLSFSEVFQLQKNNLGNLEVCLFVCFLSVIIVKINPPKHLLRTCFELEIQKTKNQFFLLVMLNWTLLVKG